MQRFIYDPIHDLDIYDDQERDEILGFEESAADGRRIEAEEYEEAYPADNYPSRFKQAFNVASKITEALNETISFRFSRLVLDIDQDMNYVDAVLALAEAHHNLDRDWESNKQLSSIVFKEVQPGALREYVRNNQEVDYRALGKVIRIGKWLSDGLDEGRDVEGIIADIWEDCCRDADLFGEDSRAEIIGMLRATWIGGEKLYALVNSHPELLELNRYQPQ